MHDISEQGGCFRTLAWIVKTEVSQESPGNTIKVRSRKSQINIPLVTVRHIDPNPYKL